MRSSRMRKIIGIVLGTVVLAGISTCVGIFAQDQAKPAATPAKKDEVHFVAKMWRSTLGDKPSVLLKGGVTFTHDDTTLTSDQVTYDKKSSIATSPGKVSISDPECNITGDKGTANFDKKLGVLEGSVTMLVKPKPTEETTSDKDSIRAKMTKPTTITCPKVEYLYKSKIATLTGGVNFKQEKRSASAQKAIYDAKKELLTLSGDVKGIDEDGQTFSAPAVKMSLKKGDEWMEAENANASFKVDVEENSTPEKK